MTKEPVREPALATPTKPAIMTAIEPASEPVVTPLIEPLIEPMIEPMIEIDRERDALLVIDLQPDFMPGGALAVAQGDQVVAPIAALLPWFQTIVATQDWHPAGHISFAGPDKGAPFSTVPLYGGEQTLWPEHCVQGSPGAQLHAGLPTDRLTVLLRKGTAAHIDSYSAFRENLGPDGQRRTTGLGALLTARGITRVMVCGLARDFCVRWTALDAAAEGFAVVVLDDLCRAVFPEQAAATSAAFAAAGVRHVAAHRLRPAQGPA